MGCILERVIQINRWLNICFTDVVSQVPMLSFYLHLLICVYLDPVGETCQ